MSKSSSETGVKPLTIKQKKFVKAYVATDGNGQEAAKMAYDVKSDAVARTVASENITKPNVKDAIEKALEKHHITMDAAVAPIADGLKATRLNFIDESAVETPDHATRLKASGMALKLMGADKSEAQQGNTIIFNRGDVVANKYVKD